MQRYIFRRLLMLAPVMLGVAFIVFTMMYFTPGDPAKMILGEAAAEDDVIKLRQEMGLDRPFIVQFGSYIANLVIHQDIGRSFSTRRPVVDEIMGRFPTTIKLAASGVLVALLLGIPTGIISATKQYSIFDSLSMVAALLGVSMPNFWQGLMSIIVFSLWLGWLPSSGYDSFSQMIMPALTIGTSSAAIITRMTRSTMLEVVRQDYIRTARAKGQKESVVIIRHALKNALIPVITVLGLQFGFLLGGAVLTETIFSIPGVGRLMVDAIKQRDFPIVQGGVLFLALTFSVINLGVDVLYAYVDPRIKSQYK